MIMPAPMWLAGCQVMAPTSSCMAEMPRWYSGHPRDLSAVMSRLMAEPHGDGHLLSTQTLAVTASQLVRLAVQIKGVGWRMWFSPILTSLAWTISPAQPTAHRFHNQLEALASLFIRVTVQADQLLIQSLRTVIFMDTRSVFLLMLTISMLFPAWLLIIARFTTMGQTQPITWRYFI